MRLTAFTDFALRALMRAAGAPARSFSTEEIAREFGISRHHLTKAVRDLSRAGFVETRRGEGGGFRLARPPETITVGAVIRALEARHALVECFRADGGDCALNPGCRLTARLARAREAFLRDLDGVTLAEVAWSPPPEQAS
jgi:Rrf2 family nitric oxide-sensitive transcriptional repressor